MATEKQLTANRRNSRESSGPCSTTRSYNALKHGLCAEHFEIFDDVASTVSIQDLLDHWNNFYQPASPLEALLVREIVTCQWRLERAPRLETGILSQSFDSIYNACSITKEETGDQFELLSPTGL